MKSEKNILIFPGGSEIGLEIRRALKYQKYLNIYGGTSTKDHTQYMYKKTINLPYIYDDRFIDEINKAIYKYKIDYIFPAYDKVQCFLAVNKKSINARIISADMNTVLLCRDKRKTYEYLSRAWYVPEFYGNNIQKHVFPLFAKPREGQGSEGVCLIQNEDEFNTILADKNYIVCEYLDGDEYTVDCFTDKNGRLCIVVPRLRNRIKNGISVNATVVKLNNEILSIANDLNGKINFLGAWFFQLKKKKEKFKLLEVSPRISGTMSLSRGLGVNFPLLSIYACEKKDVEIMKNGYSLEIDRSLANFYKTNIEYNMVYVDYDDTLIMRDKVNCKLMAFLYQSKNSDIPVTLITKHKGDIYSDLKNRCIDKNIFCKIIVINEDEEKSDYINENIKAIFIDDSFIERKKVYKIINGFVFDLDMIDLLMDSRA